MRASATTRRMTTSSALAGGLCFLLAYLGHERPVVLISVAVVAIILSFAALVLDRDLENTPIVRAVLRRRGGDLRVPAVQTGEKKVFTRRHKRIVPLNRATVLRVGARKIEATIIDLSPSGVALETGYPLRVGQPVHVGSRPASVIRLFPGGVAFEFFTYLDIATFDVDVVL